MGNENSMKRENVFWNRDVYADCPQLEDDKYLMKLTSESDWRDLLKVYSDKDAVPFFNSDNCNGEDFYLTTEERMKEIIRMWRLSYEECGFVRWSIVDKQGGCVIGTIELFHRDAADYFTDCGLLRLDIRSDYEREEEIVRIVSLILEPAFEMFRCGKIATKAVPGAAERIKGLKRLGFAAAEEKVIGHDGTRYGDYFVVVR